MRLTFDFFDFFGIACGCRGFVLLVIFDQPFYVVIVKDTAGLFADQLQDNFRQVTGLDTSL
jgi:hypothetical protein